MKRWILGGIGWLLVVSALAQQNAGFSDGLKHWLPLGTGVTIDGKQGMNGSPCVALTQSGAGILQAVAAGPLELVRLDFQVKAAGSGKGRALLRFYDRDSNLIVAYTSDFAAGAGYAQAGYYTETPPATAYATVGAEISGLDGPVYADDFHWQRHIDEHPAAAPRYDFRNCMTPFWRGDTVYNEAVLMYSENGAPATGRLLFTPVRILSVAGFDGSLTFVREKDYRFAGRVISRPAGSLMPFTADTSFDRKNDLAWYDLQSKWITVTYIRKPGWKGPAIPRKLDRLPFTRQKLLHGPSLSVVVTGMSITRGMNASGYDGVSPQMPSFVALWKRALEQKYPLPSIRLANVALPGARVDWGTRYAEVYVLPYRPDLVVIDFGMNDFWSCPPEDFKRSVAQLMQTVREQNSNAEFVLISGIKFDPDYVLPSDPNRTDYLARMVAYGQALKELEAKGVVNFDMTTLSDYLYREKKPRDCLANPLHPNDYLVRWYAQGLFETVGAR